MYLVFDTGFESTIISEAAMNVYRISHAVEK